MLLNYLKLSLRLLVRNPFFTFINVLGLSVGFTAFIILWNYSQHELKSDQFHKDYERIYRLYLTKKFPTEDWVAGALSPEIIKQAALDLSKIENYTRIINQPNFLNRSLPHRTQLFFFHTNKLNERSSFVQTRVAYADPNLFDFFSIPLLKGNPHSVLSEPNTVVVSESTAKKYFGVEEPAGELIYLNDTIPLRVTGVFEDLPSNTHLAFDIVISTLTVEKYLRLSDSWAMTHGYYKLRKDVLVTDFEKELNAYSQKHFNEIFNRMFLSEGANTLSLQPLDDLAFNIVVFDKYVPKSKYLLSVLSLVSVVILLMAWVNYINLTLSAQQKRMKELAARRAVGAKSIDFIRQFMMEAFLVNLISFLVALTMVQMIRTPAQIYFGFYVPSWTDIPLTMKLIIAFTILAGILLTGLYPAMATLKISPRVLFGARSTVKGSFNLSGLLTVFQYGTSMTLIIWACSVYLQINHILNLDIGLNKDQVVVIDLPFQHNSFIKSQINYFEDQLSSNAFLSDYAVSQGIMGDINVESMLLKQKENTEPISLQTNGGVDERFIPFYGIKVIAGRNFLPHHTADANAIILSRIATQRFGFKKPEESLGAQVLIPNNAANNGDFSSSTVIGVTEDYFEYPLFNNKYNSNHKGIVLTYRVPADPMLKVSVRIQQGQFQQALHRLQREYTTTFPHAVFNWYFLDDHVSRHYDEEKIESHQIILFTLIAIGIACLGLLGMISNKVIEKTKEIGIRKVLGAKMHQLGYVLLNSSLKQLVLSMVLCLPIAWYLTQRYLEKFSERITLQWWHYAMPVVLLLFVMLVTISSVLWKAAKSNPVEALKYE
jgi:putative ABC transport system permease protein